MMLNNPRDRGYNYSYGNGNGYNNNNSAYNQQNFYSGQGYGNNYNAYGYSNNNNSYGSNAPPPQMIYHQQQQQQHQYQQQQQHQQHQQHPYQYSQQHQQHMQYQHQAPMMMQQVITPVSKMMDGLFVGSREASQDLDFITTNKITAIINCAGGTVPNALVRHGIQYLTFRWVDHGGTVIFDQKGRTVNRIFKFIERARLQGGGILIHSVDGCCRACLAATAYYIRKLKWSMKKCLEFVSFRRPEFQPKPAYLRQLSKAAAYLDLTPSSKKQTHSSSSLLSSSSPNDAFSKRWLVPGQSVLGTLLRNTFINANSLIDGQNPQYFEDNKYIDIVDEGDDGGDNANNPYINHSDNNHNSHNNTKNGMKAKRKMKVYSKCSHDRKLKWRDDPSLPSPSALTEYSDQVRSNNNSVHAHAHQYSPYQNQVGMAENTTEHDDNSPYALYSSQSRAHTHARKANGGGRGSSCSTPRSILKTAKRRGPAKVKAKTNVSPKATAAAAASSSSSPLPSSSSSSSSSSSLSSSLSLASAPNIASVKQVSTHPSFNRAHNHKHAHIRNTLNNNNNSSSRVNSEAGDGDDTTVNDASPVNVRSLGGSSHSTHASPSKNSKDKSKGVNSTNSSTTSNRERTNSSNITHSANATVSNNDNANSIKDTASAFHNVSHAANVKRRDAHDDSDTDIYNTSMDSTQSNTSTSPASSPSPSLPPPPASAASLNNLLSTLPKSNSKTMLAPIRSKSKKKLKAPVAAKSIARKSPNPFSRHTLSSSSQQGSASASSSAVSAASLSTSLSSGADSIMPKDHDHSLLLLKKSLSSSSSSSSSSSILSSSATKPASTESASSSSVSSSSSIRIPTASTTLRTKNSAAIVNRGRHSNESPDKKSHRSVHGSTSENAVDDGTKELDALFDFSAAGHPDTTRTAASAVVSTLIDASSFPSAQFSYQKEDSVLSRDNNEYGEKNKHALINNTSSVHSLRASHANRDRVNDGSSGNGNDDETTSLSKSESRSTRSNHDDSDGRSDSIGGAHYKSVGSKGKGASRSSTSIHTSMRAREKMVRESISKIDGRKSSTKMDNNNDSSTATKVVTSGSGGTVPNTTTVSHVINSSGGNGSSGKTNESGNSATLGISGGLGSLSGVVTSMNNNDNVNRSNTDGPGTHASSSSSSAAAAAAAAAAVEINQSPASLMESIPKQIQLNQQKLLGHSLSMQKLRDKHNKMLAGTGAEGKTKVQSDQHAQHQQHMQRMPNSQGQSRHILNTHNSQQNALHNTQYQHLRHKMSVSTQQYKQHPSPPPPRQLRTASALSGSTDGSTAGAGVNSGSSISSSAHVHGRGSSTAGGVDAQVGGGSDMHHLYSRLQNGVLQHANAHTQSHALVHARKHAHARNGSGSSGSDGDEIDATHVNAHGKIPNNNSTAHYASPTLSARYMNNNGGDTIGANTIYTSSNINKTTGHVNTNTPAPSNNSQANIDAGVGSKSQRNMHTKMHLNMASINNINTLNSINKNTGVGMGVPMGVLGGGKMNIKSMGLGLGLGMNMNVSMNKTLNSSGITPGQNNTVNMALYSTNAKNKQYQHQQHQQQVAGSYFNGMDSERGRESHRDRDAFAHRDAVNKATGGRSKLKFKSVKKAGGLKLGMNGIRNTYINSSSAKAKVKINMSKTSSTHNNDNNLFTRPSSSHGSSSSSSSLSASGMKKKKRVSRKSLVKKKSVKKRSSLSNSSSFSLSSSSSSSSTSSSSFASSQRPMSSGGGRNSTDATSKRRHSLGSNLGFQTNAYGIGVGAGAGSKGKSKGKGKGKAKIKIKSKAKMGAGIGGMNMSGNNNLNTVGMKSMNMSMSLNMHPSMKNKSIYSSNLGNSSAHTLGRHYASSNSSANANANASVHANSIYDSSNSNGLGGGGSGYNPLVMPGSTPNKGILFSKSKKALGGGGGKGGVTGLSLNLKNAHLNSFSLSRSARSYL